MKKILIFLGIITCFISSCNYEPVYKEVDGRKIRVVNLPDHVIGYIEFDGHEYVKYASGNRGSICHSPKCPCLKEYKK